LQSIYNFIARSFAESKNQEVPDQDTNVNGNAKNDLQALQNHNLLIALAHGGTSGGSPFMPVSIIYINITINTAN
jgi:hypothetical protein